MWQESLRGAVIMFLLLLGAGLLRMHHFDICSLWDDETHTYLDWTSCPAPFRFPNTRRDYPKETLPGKVLPARMLK
jgi:hypothetical protein